MKSRVLIIETTLILSLIGLLGLGLFPESAYSHFKEEKSTEPSFIWNLEIPISDESNDDFMFADPPTDQQPKALEFDIPILINAKVEQFIHYFQTKARKLFTKWLARSERYIPLMRNILRENGLPEDLVFLALIESGFNPYAYSKRKASGLWQFINSTGRRYGLISNWWIDERRDPEKSTIAAAKYLKDLYEMFACWYLAAAGYNAGEKKIVNAIHRYRTEDFWELTKYHYLKRETKDYVPQMIAAALMVKEPEKYGFSDIEYQPPLQYEKVKVPEATDLRLIAKACEVSLDEIRELNPELLRWCTPPNFPDYEVKIPYGKKGIFLKNFASLSSSERLNLKIHIIKKGENLLIISKRYQIPTKKIMEINRLNKRSRISAGMELLIPLPKRQETKLHLTAQYNLRDQSGRFKRFDRGLARSNL